MLDGAPLHVRSVRPQGLQRILQGFAARRILQRQQWLVSAGGKRTGDGRHGAVAAVQHVLHRGAQHCAAARPQPLPPARQRIDVAAAPGREHRRGARTGGFQGALRVAGVVAVDAVVVHGRGVAGVAEQDGAQRAARRPHGQHRDVVIDRLRAVQRVSAAGAAAVDPESCQPEAHAELGRRQVRQGAADHADDALQELLGVTRDGRLLLRLQVEVQVQQVAGHRTAVVVRAAQDDLVRRQAVAFLKPPLQRVGHCAAVAQDVRGEPHPGVAGGVAQRQRLGVDRMAHALRGVVAAGPAGHADRPGGSDVRGADACLQPRCRAALRRAHRVPPQRTMRAELPPASVRTWSSVAMVVSPGNVVSSAPCAQPSRTASSGDAPLMSP